MRNYERNIAVASLAILAVLVAAMAWSNRDGRTERIPPAETITPITPAVRTDAPVIVTVTAIPIPTPETTPVYSPDELEALALVIYQEAGSDYCGDETRQMVGEVALNRVADDRFPGTLYDVLTQEGQYGRLHWTGLVWPERANSDVEAHAVERAYTIAASLLDGSAERILPEDVIFQSEYVMGEIVAEADGMYFCR